MTKGCTAVLIAGVLLATSTVMAQGLEFRHEGVVPLGNGNYEHTYSIIHNDPLYMATPIWDVDINYDYAHGWVSVYIPDEDWNIAHTDPRWWVFSTDVADASVGYQGSLTGITIEAATPLVGDFSIKLTTGSDHQEFATTMASLPLPEPCSALLLMGGLVFLRRRR